MRSLRENPNLHERSGDVSLRENKNLRDQSVDVSLLLDVAGARSTRHGRCKERA